MKKVIVVFFLFCWSCSSAQNEYVNWYFGSQVGLNFCNGLHVSQVNQFPGTYAASATISDKVTGQLLFHTDGQTVWNSQFEVMQNGSGLNGSNESSQGALIVPQPGNNSIYYIFTTSESATPPDSLEYSTVNMNNNDGLGAVVSKNNFLHLSCEQLTAVYNKTGNFYWVLCLDSNSFLEYKIDSSGLNATPVLYPTNVVFAAWLSMCSGFLKASPNATILACSFQGPDTISLYNFNNTTGEINITSKLQFVTNDYDVWGLSFSPNSSKLYVNVDRNPGTLSNIYQYDVSSANPILINDSRVTLYSYYYYGDGHVFNALQLGPDRKLYIERQEVDSLTVIDAPDNAGLACNFRFNAISLNGLATESGLSNNIDNLYEWAQPLSLSVTASSQGCKGVGNFIINASKDYNDYEVSYGDGTDVTLDSLQFTASHQYTAAGNYIVTVKGLLGCVYDSVSATINIPECYGSSSSLIIPSFIYGRGSQTQWSIINLPNNTSATIYDELGRTLYKTSNYANNYDMRNLPPAMYFYRLDLQSGEELTGKIMVVK